jgi:hypothetical protein
MKTNTSKKSPIRHLVPNNPQADQQLTGGKDLDDKIIERDKKRTLYDNTFRSHYYQTHKGHWKRSDEPDEAEQFRQSDRIQQMLKARRQQQASRDRLKQKPGGVPLRRDGKKLFDEFMRESSIHRPHQGVKKKKMPKDLEVLRNLYNAASALEFEKWVLFVTDDLSNR